MLLHCVLEVLPNDFIWFQYSINLERPVEQFLVLFFKGLHPEGLFDLLSYCGFLREQLKDIFSCGAIFENYEDILDLVDFLGLGNSWHLQIILAIVLLIMNSLGCELLIP